jgi:hypothetical protein
MSDAQSPRPASQSGSSAAGGAPSASRRRWTHDRIEAELSALLAQRSTWPNQEEFAQYGLRGLAMAVSRYGGITYWAERMGVRTRPGQRRGGYDERQARLDTEELIARLGYLPNARRIRAEGFPRLASLVNRRGGARGWLAFLQARETPPR